MIELTDHFSGRAAATYDQSSSEMFAPEKVDPVVDVLAELAGTGRALEFASGTGRIALPLAARGIPVSGIDLSPDMTAELRAKPGGQDLDITIGDIASTRIDGDFRVVYLVFNTIGNLTSQDAQVACFANAAAHLEPGGYFVIETGVPKLRALPPGQNAVPFAVGPRNFAFDLYDCATQQMSSNYITLNDDGTARQKSIPFRYTWPAELDLMARLAGMTLRNRWQDWTATPFTHDSQTHISIWQKPA
ncbi:class I SAM-dependent DNA methyltransferase [Glycomyces algeriensis]|uniref:Methyltransferase n=1 Tax=Glycomyces algeriensis TaxID=256037 RepID=A0A9W6G8G0_9ACTN|nr:class I SAM-dependent methyltransferase [Glycomyces algeriensis]MDA1365331.1 class I SAM-dependent methyltransferase [Glycomyces algeriensis]MDR7349605.1 SAM-dependent methyltransferase [Glycomyces algeriensis]GLI42311.1 methyltransferase [Glycomyces algeriensis]